VTCYNIVHAYRSGSGKQDTLIEAMRPMITYTVGFFICVYWARFSPNDVLGQDARAYFLLSGTLYANMSCRLIIAQLTTTRCELVNWLLWPTAAAAAVSLLAPGVTATMEMAMVYALLLLVTLVHLHYVICVVIQMCEHLKIDCFRIPSSTSTSTPSEDGKGDHRLLVSESDCSSSEGERDEPEEE